MLFISPFVLKRAWKKRETFCITFSCGYSGLPIYADRYKKSTPNGANFVALILAYMKVSSFQLREQERKAQGVSYVGLCSFCFVWFVYGVMEYVYSWFISSFVRPVVARMTASSTPAAFSLRAISIAFSFAPSSLPSFKPSSLPSRKCFVLLLLMSL